MDIRCDCGTFWATLKAFPRNTPGRLVCYCDDCQAYLRHLKRTDLLDAQGGTEIIPAYPADVRFVQGREQLRCVRLTPDGIFRFFTSCCNTPIANTSPGSPWAGFLRCVYTNGQGPQEIDQALGPVRSRIMGRYAKGIPPAGTPKKFDPKAMLSVLPFMVKGKLLGKSRPSPFFADDGRTAIAVPQVLHEAKRPA